MVLLVDVSMCEEANVLVHWELTVCVSTFMSSPFSLSSLLFCVHLRLFSLFSYSFSLSLSLSLSLLPSISLIHLGAPQTFADEASLLKKVSNHKSIVSPPSIQILNFSDDSLQHFFSTLLQQKQLQVRELFMSGGCMEAYIYPLYGVTMATRVKVQSMTLL